MRFPRRWRRKPEGPAVPDDPPSLTEPVARADRFGFSDLLVEAIADIGSRPGRLIMTIAGTVLGIGALVATIGFAQTAAHQIARQFDAVKATQLVIEPAQAQTRSGGSVATARLPWDGVERVERLVGVESAAFITELSLGTDTVTAVPVNDPAAAAVAPPTVVAASPEVLRVLGGTLTTGRMYDLGHEARADRVVVLGARAAERLQVSRIDRQPSIFIGGVAYAVIGIYSDLQARGELLDAVIMPMSTARHDRALLAPGTLQARIRAGTGPQLASQAPVALLPGDTESLKVQAPGAASELGQNVQADVNIVFVVLGVVVLLAGALGIANVTMLNVMERVPEIGLRRALGATGRQIAGQFVAESVVIGLLGGLMGSALAVAAVVGISVSQGWTPVVDPWIAVAGVVLGAVVGLVAGGFPARRAARIEPVSALRAGG